MIVESPAKLNVFLEVIGKRPDGFHDLETIMLRTKFSDTLRLNVRADAEIHIQLSSDSTVAARHDFPTDPSNLICCAARAIQQRTGCRQGVDVVITKRIPPQAGLAGGSSNAATTLRAVNLLWKTGLSDDDLHLLAAQLGSDVNFLLSGHRAALCHGRGEIVEPLPISGAWFFVACRPDSGNSTPQVFQHTRLPTERMSSAAVQDALQSGLPEQLSCFNRLTPAAMFLNAEMSDLLTHMQQTFNHSAFMSGSGSTCFVVASSKEQAVEFRQQLSQSVPWPVWLIEV